MNIIDKLQNLADRNQDGKVSKADLDSMKGEHDSSVINSLKMKADLNGDGRLSMDDIKSMMK